jgi:hypothetical protein
VGNLAKLFSTGNLHPRENFRDTEILASNGAEVVIECDGCSSFSLDLRGTFSGTIEVSGTVDGTNWTPLAAVPVNQASRSYVAAVTGTAAGLWEGKCGGYWKIRARCTAYTSGSFTTTLSASNALLDDSLNRSITPIIATNTAAAGAAVTLSLAAPGTGLRHYLTYIRIGRVASTLLTAGATPVLVTTTNIPGSLVFSMPADAAAQGTVFAYQEDFSYPIAASAQATATTIVAPVTAGVIWRITAGYYVAP